MSETSFQEAQAAGPQSVAKGKPRNIFLMLSKSPVVMGAAVVLLLAGLFFGFRAWQDISSKIYIENSEIQAPIITLGPDGSGVLKEVYVKEGDHVNMGQPLFNVGGRTTNAMTPGIITYIQDTPGQMASPQSAIVKMYDPESLRVVGHIQEDQGLNDLKVGQKAYFTLDAVDGKQYQGTVESIATVASDSSVVFSISDKRQEKDFDVKIRFELNNYPDIKNGMSAKIWVIK
jgi:multidrug resistance efflux pump